MSERKENKDRIFGSAKNYIPCYINDEYGNMKQALFTDIEIKKALERGNKNPEDFESQSFFESWLKIFD